MEILLDQRSARSVDKERLERLSRQIVKNERIPENSELSIVLTDNAEMQTINQKFRDENKATDVISLPQFHNKEEILEQPEDFPLLLGDVVISLEQAEQQAAERDWSYQEECDLLLAHGILHLLGYDHAAPEEEKEMFERQQQYVESL